MPQLQPCLLVSERHQSLPPGDHYYRADGGEGWDGQSGQIKREIKKGQVRAEKGERGGEKIEAA